MEHDKATNPPLRVLIAEDAYLLREGTRLLLQEYGFDVVGSAAEYQQVLDECRRLKPDVVLMDIRMPPTFTMEGIRAAHVIRAELPQIGVVMLSQHDDESYVWELLKDGVSGFGYLNKIRVGDVDQVVRALQEVAAGGSVLDSRIVDRLLSLRSNKPGSPLSTLTPTEHQVLKLMAEGKNNERIRRELNVALGTVEKRAASVFSKLGLSEEKALNRRVSAVLIYLRESGTA
ncbi:MAG: response regulator transcription factor [Actinomycetota bacterium]